MAQGLFRFTLWSDSSVMGRLLPKSEQCVTMHLQAGKSYATREASLQGHRKRALSEAGPRDCHQIQQTAPSEELFFGWKMYIYMDESGDLGWSLSLPYQKGGSSRYLVIAALVLPETHLKHVERLMRQLYNTFGWPTDKEKKWVDMTAKARQTFAEATANLLSKYPADIRCMAIVARKAGVLGHRRRDPNLLYNYMTKQLLLDEMAHHKVVYLVPDARSIKVESGNTFKDYLQTELLYTAEADTTLYCRHTDSSSSKEIQFTDMLAGAIGSFHEWAQAEPYNVLKDRVPVQKLFF